MAEQIPDTPEMQPLTRIQVLIAMGVTAVVLLVISKVWLHFSAVPLLAVRFSVQSLLQGIGLGIGISIASAIVYRVWAEYRRSANEYLTLVLKPLLPPDILWLGLLPGLSEELLFRGVLLPEVGLDFLGVLISSLCFGVLHMSNLKQWSYVVWASIVGVALGMSAVWTGNLLVPIVAHVLTNLISGVVWKLGDRTSKS
ncbi:CPBP family intramembrane metalloprotease [Cyanobacteria bacterium FACHB-63]|nr:CPBP family intramembrane metalloprotease [Cyanobacteria bacterium FACHB-63]